MSDESNNLNLDDKNTTTYDKAKLYWQQIEPTLSGMLGGIYEVAYIGEFYGFHFSELSCL
jgi:hypothetical protein